MRFQQLSVLRPAHDYSVANQSLTGGESIYDEIHKFVWQVRGIADGVMFDLATYTKVGVKYTDHYSVPGVAIRKPPLR